jgi:O-antigen/teichoic acid export membrane protein
MIDRLRGLAVRVLGSRIVRDSSVLLVASYASMGLSVVTSVILARMLGPDGYGLVVLAMTVVSTVTQFMDIRTGEGLIKFVGSALARDERDEALTFFTVGLTADFLLMLATFALAAVAAPIATQVYPESESLRALVVIYIFTIPFSTLQGSFSSMLNVFKRFNLLAAAQISLGLIQLAVLTALVARGAAAVMWGYVIVSAVSFVVYAALGVVLLARNVGLGRVPLRGGAYRAAWRQFLPFAFQTSVTQSIKALAVNADMLILGALRPPAQVAYYRIATSAASLITMPTSPASTVLYPEMTEAFARDQIDRVRRLVGRYMIATLGIASAFVVFYVFTAEWLVRLLYAGDYADAADFIARLIVIVGVGVAVESVFRWVRPATLARGKPGLTTFYSTAAIVFRVAVLVVLIYTSGALGAALAYDLTVVFTIALIVFYVLPRLGVWQPFRKPDSA